MQLLSQRDPRWRDIKLGFTTTTTIGSHGCTITCLAMISDTTPDYVNERLKAVKGYAQGNLVIWTKIPEALPQLQFIERGTVYNNDRVKNNLPALVEVNGLKIGGVRHWVVFIGNQKIYDPWYGNQNSTSFYTPLYGYALFKKMNQSLSPDEKIAQIKTIVNSNSSASVKLDSIKSIIKNS